MRCSTRSARRRSWSSGSSSRRNVRTAISVAQASAAWSLAARRAVGIDGAPVHRQRGQAGGRRATGGASKAQVQGDGRSALRARRAAPARPTWPTRWRWPLSHLMLEIASRRRSRRRLGVIGLLRGSPGPRRRADGRRRRRRRGLPRSRSTPATLSGARGRARRVHLVDPHPAARRRHRALRLRLAPTERELFEMLLSDARRRPVAGPGHLGHARGERVEAAVGDRGHVQPSSRSRASGKKTASRLCSSSRASSCAVERSGEVPADAPASGPRSARSRTPSRRSATPPRRSAGRSAALDGAEADRVRRSAWPCRELRRR